MRILVTGGSGLVGRHVVAALSGHHEVTNLDLRPPGKEGTPSIQADVLNIDEMRRVVRDVDAVVHLAGIPNPLHEPGEKVMRVNVQGTFNVLSAAAENGIGRFVLMSSESTLGFPFSTQRIWPEYVPIDEDHVLRAHDPYGLSKILAEALCARFSMQAGLTTICLRPPWIWVPDPSEKEFYRNLIREYEQWPKNLWAYIHVNDVIQAVEAALTASLPSKHETFFICADENWVREKPRNLLQRFYPETKKILTLQEDTGSLISTRKAKQILGFSPRFTWRDLFDDPRKHS